MKFARSEFDGSTEEFLKVSHLFSGLPGGVSAAPSHAMAKATEAAASNEEPQGPITAQLVLRVLTRRGLSTNMRKVLKTMLAKGGSTGLTTTQISDAVGVTRAELAGVFGAFGRRVANTAGWPKEASFVEYARDEDDDHADWRYWLPQVVRDVLESGKVKL